MCHCCAKMLFHRPRAVRLMQGVRGGMPHVLRHNQAWLWFPLDVWRERWIMESGPAPFYFLAPYRLELHIRHAFLTSASMALQAMSKMSLASPHEENCAFKKSKKWQISVLLDLLGSCSALSRVPVGHCITANKVSYALQLATRFHRCRGSGSRYNRAVNIPTSGLFVKYSHVN